MSKQQQPDPAEDFTAGERNYIRLELDMFFSTLPTAAEGFMLKRWRTGPLSGQPKIPLNAQGLVERGLMRVEAGSSLPRLFFTETGLAALRRLAADSRAMNPKKFAHIRRELGIDPMPETVGPETVGPETVGQEKAVPDPLGRARMGYEGARSGYDIADDGAAEDAWPQDEPAVDTIPETIEQQAAGARSPVIEKPRRRR